MKRGLFGLALGLLLTGCGKHYWEAPGRGVEEFRESSYPPPLAAMASFSVSPEVRMLFARYRGYTEGREPLASMAYACLTFLTKMMAKGKPDAVKKFNISVPVLDKLGLLSSRKGERKVPSDGPYTAQEETWVREAVRVLIRRAAEHAAGVTVKQITMSDLPPLP